MRQGEDLRVSEFKLFWPSLGGVLFWRGPHIWPPRALQWEFFAVFYCSLY